MFTKSNNQKTFTTTQFHTFNDKKHMKQNLCASTFEIIKATFWPQFWRFGKAIDVYVELISCWGWSFNKHWFESFCFIFNSSQVHQHTQYERLLKSFAFAIFHQTPWAHIKIKFHLHWKHIRMYALVANYLVFATSFKLSHKMATSTYKYCLQFHEPQTWSISNATNCKFIRSHME